MSANWINEMKNYVESIDPEPVGDKYFELICNIVGISRLIFPNQDKITFWGKEK